MESTPYLDFVIALFIGALVGIERERRKTGPDGTGSAGLRTFIFIAQAGALAAFLSIRQGTPWIFAGIGVGVCGLIVVGYMLQPRANRSTVGMTTEMAAIVVYLLGGATLFGYQALAVALSVVTTALLAYKKPLHGAIGKLSEEDVRAGIKLLIASFIVLRVLPNRAVDPWGALNPYKIWLLVVLISGLSLVGYAASRWLGNNKGASLTGFFGGLVSSTVVTLTFARRSRDEHGKPGMADALAAGLLLAWLVMFGRVIAEVAVVHPPLLGQVLWPMTTMGVLAAVAGLVCFARSNKAAAKDVDDVPLKNPFSLWSALKFALFFTAVLLVVKLVQQRWPGQGMYVVAALAGLTDVDAITLSMADYARSGGSPDVAVTAITVAAITNTLVKFGFVAVLGSKPLKVRILAATVVILGGGVVALLV